MKIMINGTALDEEVMQLIKRKVERSESANPQVFQIVYCPLPINILAKLKARLLTIAR